MQACKITIFKIKTKIKQGSTNASREDVEGRRRHNINQTKTKTKNSKMALIPKIRETRHVHN